jgi:hypothetical protein
MARFGQGLIQGLINPGYELNTTGMMAGGLAGSIAERRKQELQKQQQQAALMSAYSMGQSPGGSDPASAMAALSQAVPGIEAKDLVAMQQAGIQTSESSASAAQKKTAAQKRQQGIETLTQIANRSDTNNPNVQKAMRQVALNYGLNKEDLAMVLPSASDKVTRGTGTIDINGKPTLVNFVYDEEGRVISREVLGPKSEKAGVNVTNIIGPRESEKFFEKLQEGDASQVENGRTAQQTLPAIKQARELITDTPEVFGAGASVLNDMRRGYLTLFNVMGVSNNDPVYSKLSNQTSAADLSKTLTQEFVRPRMEATKGAISDKEFATFIESVPNLLQTPEGYGRVLDYMENALNAQIVYAENLELAYEDQEGKTPSEFKRSWNKFSSELPLGAFDRGELEQLWQTYSKNGNLSGVRFTVNSPNSNEITVVSFEDVKEAANRKKVSINAFIENAKNQGTLGLLF